MANTIVCKHKVYWHIHVKVKVIFLLYFIPLCRPKHCKSKSYYS